MKKENAFQSKLIKRIRNMFPGCIVLKNDANHIQGIPDLTILFNECWAMLECKMGNNAKRQPNQEYYINKANKMSFACFICPETEESVLKKLNRFFNRNKKEDSI